MTADYTPPQLIRLWEVGDLPDGSARDYIWIDALNCRWRDVFGYDLPKVVPIGGGLDEAEPTAATRPDADKIADDTVLSTADVLRITGLSKTNLELRRCQGPFPQPIKLSVQGNGDPARDVEEWIRQRPRARPSANKGNSKLFRLTLQRPTSRLGSSTTSHEEFDCTGS